MVQDEMYGVIMKTKQKLVYTILLGLFFSNNFSALAMEARQLTLDSIVEIAINNSYQTKRLEFDIKRSLHWLNAERAGLKTQIYMNLISPDLQKLSEHKWNSTLLRDEIVRQNTQNWQSDLSIKHPLIFWGYPTNGSLSLNYKIYKYTQKDHLSPTDYYNRLYLKFEQPFFLPNELKNDLEKAELDLKEIKLEYIGDRVEIIEDVSDDYYDLFRLTYNNQMYTRQIQYLIDLENIISVSPDAENVDMASLEQVKLELANVQEKLSSNRSSLRQRWVYLKQRLRLNEPESLYVKPTITIKPITVDLDQAISYGYNNDPYLQQLHIRKRRSELDVEDQKGNNAFHVTLEMTYGIEKGDPRFNGLWREFDNSNSITLNAYVPIWDGGQRKERIQAETIDLQQRVLDIEEEKNDKKNDIITAYTNLNEYYKRAESMMQSLQLAQQITGTNIEKFKNKQISLQDILQIIARTRETDENFIDVYLSYRLSLLDLLTETYYNYEKNISLYDEVDIKYD
jgi:outer membrane protein